jgi:SNF2 family DNA or RNA helicase
LKFKPHEYQKYAKQFIIDQPYCGCFYEPGLGKTAIALSAVDELLFDYFDVSRVLVIAPLRVARDTWPNESSKWDELKHLKLSKVLGSEKERIEALNKKADIYIINRENIPWLIEHYEKRKFPFDMIVIDELSSFKSPSAERFKALRKIRPVLKRVVGLTGTPAPNGLLDLWSQVYLLDRGERLGKTLGSYRERYFLPDKRNQQVIFTYKPKEGAEETIYEKLSDICVSMKSVDYIQMPERIDNFIEISLSEKEMKLYQKLEREMLIPFKYGVITAVNAATLAGKLLQLANGAVYDEEKKTILIHDRKIEALEDLVESANGKSILVFYGFRHDRDRIKSVFKDRARELLTSEDMEDWNNGKIEIAITHPASTGHGLNLQAGGSTIVWFGLTWSLELYEQANARLWRQGQTETVVIHHITAKGTIDEQVILALQQKSGGQQILMDAIKAKIGCEING